jgi:hypothetical protein
MTGAAWRDFVLARPRTAKLATVRADGRPHVAPIWIDLDGDTVVFNTGADSVKGRNMRRQPRVMLCVDTTHHPSPLWCSRVWLSSSTTWTRCACGRRASAVAIWASTAPKSSGLATASRASSWCGSALRACAEKQASPTELLTNAAVELRIAARMRDLEAIALLDDPARVSTWSGAPGGLATVVLIHVPVTSGHWPKPASPRHPLHRLEHGHDAYRQSKHQSPVRQAQGGCAKGFT